MGVAVYADGALAGDRVPISTSRCRRTCGRTTIFPSCRSTRRAGSGSSSAIAAAQFADVHSDTPAHRAAWEIFGAAYDGDHWTAPVAVPFSAGRTDVRGGFATDGRGNLYAAWATDNRDFEEFLFQHSDIYAGRIPALAGAGARSPGSTPKVMPQTGHFPAPSRPRSEDLRRIRGYAMQSGGKTYQIYRGDTHRHSEFSMDGNNDGSLHQTYRYAIDAAELDYLGMTDHNGDGGPDIPYINWLRAADAPICSICRALRAAVLLRAQRACIRTAIAIFCSPRAAIPRCPIRQAEQAGQDGRRGAVRISEEVQRHRHLRTPPPPRWAPTGAITIRPSSRWSRSTRATASRPNTKARPRPPTRQSRLRSPADSSRPATSGTRGRRDTSWGCRPPPITFRRTSPTRASIATDFTREGLLDAMRQRHSYGATDNIVLDYRMQTGGKEYLQGDIVKAPGDFKLIGEGDRHDADSPDRHHQEQQVRAQSAAA